MRINKKILVLLAVIALLAVALPLSSAFADPATAPTNPTVQQPYPTQQGPYYYPGYYCPWYGPNSNYQPNYDWYNSGNNGGYGWNQWGCW